MQFSEIHGQCTGNGLMDCACNFINACKWDSSTNKFSSFAGSKTELNKFIPRGLEKLAKDESQVAQICEPGSIGIFYDCKNRIPLASTFVMTGDQYNSIIYKRRGRFKFSSHIPTDLQQTDQDYNRALQRKPCYEILSRKGNFVEQNWYVAITGDLSVKPRFWRCSAIKEKSQIHRGHLIAAQYARGSDNRVRETFVYTNAVPQFGALNSNDWQTSEKRLITWARNNCDGAPIHIIVGSVPSTFGRNENRFFGEAGFSDFNDRYSMIYMIKGPFRVNVPAYMWTAACCDTGSNIRNVAFYAPNHPGKNLVRAITLNGLFDRIQATAITLFPKMDGCNKDEHFVEL